MRTLRFRPSLSLPTCIHRKISDDRPKRTLELREYPLQVLETRRKERLAELKAECLELKNQLSEHSLQAALLREVQLENESVQTLLPGESRNGGSSSSIPENFEEKLRVRRQERLKNIRRELEEFAIKYSLGEFSEKIEGLEESTFPLRKSKSEDWAEVDKKVSDLSIGGNENTVNASILLRIQKQREQELQRARMELKHLAFRLKHKLDQEN